MTSSALLSAPLPARKRKLRIWHYNNVAPSPVETPARILGKRTRGELRHAPSSAATGAHAPPPQASNGGSKKTEWAEDGQICSNCGCTGEHVKYWCGNLMPGIICNTCGHYFQTHRNARPVPIPTPAPAATNRPLGWNPVNGTPSHPSTSTSTSTTASTPTSNNNNPSSSDEYESDPHDLLTTLEEPRLIYHLDRLLYQLGEDWDLAIVWNDIAHFLNLEFGTLAVDAGVALAARLPHPERKKRYETLMMGRPEGITRDPWRLRELAEEMVGTQKLRQRCEFHQKHNFYWGGNAEEPNEPNEEGRRVLYVENQPGVLTNEAANALEMPYYDNSEFLVGQDSHDQPDMMPRDDGDDEQ